MQHNVEKQIMYINSHKQNTNDQVYDNLQNTLYFLMKIIAKNGNKRKVVAYGGDIEISLSFTFGKYWDKSKVLE